VPVPGNGAVGPDGNHYHCSVCNEPGDVTCCENCPRVYHMACLRPGTVMQLAAEFQDSDDEWYCQDCVSDGLVNRVHKIIPDWGKLKSLSEKRRGDAINSTNHGSGIAGGGRGDSDAAAASQVSATP
ncbi:unnamed protein product, partial [Discosporangium mesarthrocarpum]